MKLISRYNKTSDSNNFGNTRMKNCTRAVRKEHSDAPFSKFLRKILEYFRFRKNADNLSSGFAIGRGNRIHNPVMIRNESGNFILFQTKRSLCSFLTDGTP